MFEDPAIFQWLNVPAVQAVLGNPVRVYGFEDAPHGANIESPDLIWQFVDGRNDFTLCGNTRSGDSRIQFDAYGKTPAQARQAAKVAETELAKHGFTASYNLRVRDAETKLYRYSWDMQFSYTGTS